MVVQSTRDNVVLVFKGTNKFSGNSAKYAGGAICAEFNTSLAFMELLISIITQQD